MLRYAVVMSLVMHSANAQADCSAGRDAGYACDSNAQQRMFYFDSLRGVCQPFLYAGCGGNGNRFVSAADCRANCVDKSTAVQAAPSDTASTAELRKLFQSACSADFAVDHLPPPRCSGNSTCEQGFKCQNTFCCPQPDFTCGLRYDSGKFAEGGEKSDRYFYTDQYKTCMRFSFYGSMGNFNNFENYNACMRMCGYRRNQN